MRHETFSIPSTDLQRFHCQNPCFNDQRTVYIPRHLTDKFYFWLFFSEGAGDCSSCVAVMLELARGVSQWAHGFKNSVIFLFNTGEEEGLNGAHSFITQVCRNEKFISIEFAL